MNLFQYLKILAEIITFFTSWSTIHLARYFNNLLLNNFLPLLLEYNKTKIWIQTWTSYQKKITALTKKIDELVVTDDD